MLLYFFFVCSHKNDKFFYLVGAREAALEGGARPRLQRPLAAASCGRRHRGTRLLLEAVAGGGGGGRAPRLHLLGAARAPARPRRRLLLLQLPLECRRNKAAHRVA